MIISTDESKTNFVFRFSYNPVLIQAIKDTLRGRKWNQEEKVWTVPLNASSIEQVESFADEWGFALSEDARLAIAMRSINAERREVLSSAIESDYQVQGLARPLMPHQSAAVLYGKQTISKGRGLIIADEPGLGKSASSLALAHEFNAWPMLIVCLSSLKLNWLNEVKMTLPDKSVLVITAASGKNKKLVKTHPNVISPQDYMAVKPYADIVIVNYDIVRDITENPNSQSNFDRYICEPGTLTEYLVENLKHKTIVFDEGHVLSNYKSKQSRAAKKLAARKQIRLLLTGTPVVNKPDDLVTQLSIIGQLDAFGGFDYFRDMYCGKTRDGGVHQVQPDTLVELHNTMRQTCYIRRVKTEVIKSLPEKLYATQIFELDNQRAYSKKLNEFMDDSSLHAHGRGIVEIDSLKELVALGKMKSVVEWIETTFIVSKTKLIIFAWHKSVQDELYKSIPNAARLHADDPDEVQEQNKKRFNEDDDCLVIVCSMKIGSMGHTLVGNGENVTNLAFMEFGWNPKDHIQAEDRAHRIGQRGQLTVWNLVADNTVDGDILDLIQKKRVIVDAIADGKLSPEAEQSLNIYGDLMRRLSDARMDITNV